MSLKVNEIFCSIQGESSHAGIPCVFVRLTGCNLRCAGCDSTFAYEEGTDMDVAQVLERVEKWDLKTVEITGGEPLLQQDVYGLMASLLDKGFRVLLETNGSLDLAAVDDRVIKIIDLKSPGSGMSEHVKWENLEVVQPHDNLKLVLHSRADYEWAKEKVLEHGLTERCPVLFSPAFGILEPGKLAEWICADRLPVRLQLQLHKYIWKPGTRGV
jgi:7-carboxy-7-deazaguanine synthase